MKDDRTISKKVEDTFGELTKYGHPEFYEILYGLADLHSRKNKDYASQADPMANFRRVGDLCEKYNIFNAPIPAELKVAIIYMLKQFDAYMKLLGSGEKGGVEGVPERLQDVSVYSIIEMILYKEGLKQNKDDQ